MKGKFKILIIEDDNDINRLLSEMLINDGYHIKSAYSGTEGMLYVNSEEWHLVLLDLMLPGKSGEDLIMEIREKNQMPILVISAKEEKGIKARVLRSGADDFISKPFDVDEVLARVESNLRRYLQFSNEKLETAELEYKEIHLDYETRQVMVNSNEIFLTGREFDILKLFMENPKKVFSKANLFESIWGEEFIGDDNTLSVHISNIRSKLSKGNAEDEYIKTVWGIGYKL